VTPQPNSPGWADPAFPATQNQQSDSYKVALVVLRVLARDFHTRDPERAGAELGRDLMPMLRSSLRASPDVRPRVAAWTGPLLARAAQLDRNRQEGANAT
jgi:hypothetical protein